MEHLEMMGFQVWNLLFFQGARPHFQVNQPFVLGTGENHHCGELGSGKNILLMVPTRNPVANSPVEGSYVVYPIIF